MSDHTTLVIGGCDPRFVQVIGGAGQRGVVVATGHDESRFNECKVEVKASFPGLLKDGALRTIGEPAQDDYGSIAYFHRLQQRLQTELGGGDASKGATVKFDTVVICVNGIKPTSIVNPEESWFGVPGETLRPYFGPGFRQVYNVINIFGSQLAPEVGVLLVGDLLGFVGQGAGENSDSYRKARMGLERVITWFALTTAKAKIPGESSTASQGHATQFPRPGNPTPAPTQGHVYRRVNLVLLSPFYHPIEQISGDRLDWIRQYTPHQGAAESVPDLSWIIYDKVDHRKSASVNGSVIDASGILIP